MAAKIEKVVPGEKRDDNDPEAGGWFLLPFIELKVTSQEASEMWGIDFDGYIQDNIVGSTCLLRTMWRKRLVLAVGAQPNDLKAGKLFLWAPAEAPGPCRCLGAEGQELLGHMGDIRSALGLKKTDLEVLPKESCRMHTPLRG
jgi:hypothetical protein